MALEITTGFSTTPPNGSLGDVTGLGLGAGVGQNSIGSGTGESVTVAPSLNNSANFYNNACKF